MNGRGTLELEGPFVAPAPGEGARREAALPELEGPFELGVAGEAPQPRTTAAPARDRYAAWSDADDRAKARNPHEQVVGGRAVTASNVVVYPPAAGRLERVFVLQNFKVDGASLRDHHRAYLADTARWMAGDGRWRVFIEAHASRTGTQRHDDALSEDRYLATRAFLETELRTIGLDAGRVRIAGEGVGFRHTVLPGEDPKARSVYVVIQPDPSAFPPQLWPPRAAPVAWPPAAPPSPAPPAPPVPTPPAPPPAAALNPPRWAPILKPHVSVHTALRTGNAVRQLIDGTDTFQAMVQAIRTAQTPEHYIYLLVGWLLVDDFELIKGDKSTTIQALFSAASARGVQIRALLWAKPVGGNLMETRRINKLKNGAAIRDNETEHPTYGGHHEKVLVVKGKDGLIGFCGGVDINKDRVAVVGSTTGEPLHDVHCRITGPSTWDLLQGFIRRWDHHPDHVAIDKKQGGLLGRSEPVPAAVSAPAVGPASSVPHTCSVVVARTFNPVTKGTLVPRQRDIRNLFMAAIPKAQRYIYIEDQYLVSLEAARALRAAVPKLAHLTILIPGSEATDMPCVWKFRRDFVNTLTTGLSTTDLAKVRIFQRVSKPISKPPKFGFHTYIHAKTWMIDDELAAIGSANVNRRGWEHDSECEAFIFDDAAPGSSGGLTFAQKARMDLWSEHLGMPAASFRDGVASASHWLTLPPSASVMRYNPTAGKDTVLGKPVPDGVCETSRAVVDPGLDGETVYEA